MSRRHDDHRFELNEQDLPRGIRNPVRFILIVITICGGMGTVAGIIAKANGYLDAPADIRQLSEKVSSVQEGFTTVSNASLECQRWQHEFTHNYAEQLKSSAADHDLLIAVKANQDMELKQLDAIQQELSRRPFAPPRSQ